MKILRMTLFALAGLATLIACERRNSDPFVNTTPKSQNYQRTEMQKFFDENLENATQSFTIDASVSSVIEGDKGTRLRFYPNSFVDDSGNEVSGLVNIELVEIYDKADMILMNKQTVGKQNGVISPIISGGEFNVTATQNGMELSLKPYRQFSAEVQAPNGTDSNMSVFYQESESADSLVWEEADSVFLTNDTSNTFYNVLFDSIGWINCDYFNGSAGPLKPVSVTVPKGATDSTCSVFISFDGLNSVTGVYSYNSGVFSTGLGYSIPVGQPVHFIVMGVVNNQLHAAIVGTNIANNHMEVVSTWSPTTTAQLKADIQNLP